VAQCTEPALRRLPDLDNIASRPFIAQQKIQDLAASSATGLGTMFELRCQGHSGAMFNCNVIDTMLTMTKMSKLIPFPERCFLAHNG